MQARQNEYFWQFLTNFGAHRNFIIRKKPDKVKFSQIVYLSLIFWHIIQTQIEKMLLRQDNSYRGTPIIGVNKLEGERQGMGEEAD